MKSICTSLIKITCLFAVCAVCVLPIATNADIPPRPEEINFPPLEYTPPQRADYRHRLSNGIPVYLAPSHEFPLINVAFVFEGGSYLDPAEMIGLAGTCGAMMRQGGTIHRSAEDLDEEFDFLAAVAQTYCGQTESGATLNALSSNFQESFALFLEMVRTPGFQEDRYRLHQDEMIERMKQRNDDADSIIRREWGWLVLGEDHYAARRATQTMVESITTDDLRGIHQQIFNPTNLIIAVNGDFEVDDMLSLLEENLADWSLGTPASDPSDVSVDFAPGVYHVEKDIPQGKVYLGLRTITRDDPDYFPCLLMNEILGGGGFTSRITNTVRTEEGLAYDAHSIFTMPVKYPGFYRAAFQSKNSTVALGIKLIFDEIQRIREEPVSEEELVVAKNSFIETFPRTFESKPRMLGVFVDDELTHRAVDYWNTYRDNVRNVTADDIQRVAQKYLVPDEMALLIVGRWDEIAEGDPDGRADMSLFFDGQMSELPLRDPMTLEPIDPNS